MKLRNLFLTRREMLSRCGMGMGLVALRSTLGDTGYMQAAPLTHPSIRSPRSNRRYPRRPSECCICS